MTTNTEIDPLEAAMTAAPMAERPKHRFGEIQIDRYFAAWDHDENDKAFLREFDPTIDKIEQRLIHLDMTLIPVKGQYNTTRNVNVPGKEWDKIIKPSLAALGTDLISLNSQYVELEEVPTGRRGVNKTTGEAVEYTTFKFLRVFPEVNECIDASNAFFSQSSVPSVNGAPLNGNGVADRHPQATPASKPAGMTPESAWSFVVAVYKSSGSDVNKFITALSGMPAVTAIWPLDSKEVQELINPQMPF